MAAVPQKESATFWQALNDLEFVTSFFTWLFRLMSRLAEPLMTLSAIYIIVEAGVPAISQPVVQNLAVGLLIAAPEVILPGGFILSGELRAKQNPHWWMLSAVCCAFVLLMAVTFIDLFVWHLKGVGFQWLLCFRCVAAFGYSILFRVITHKQFSVDVAQPVNMPDLATKFDDLQVSFGRQIQGLSREIREGKPVAIVTEKRPNCEQVKWATDTPSMYGQSDFSFVECVHIPVKSDAQQSEQVSEQVDPPSATVPTAGYCSKKRAVASNSIEQKIRRYVRKNPTANQTEIAGALNISRNTVRKYLGEKSS